MTIRRESRIDIESDSVQRLAPQADFQRFEGIGFSLSGDVLGVATSDTNSVFLFRKARDGKFDEAPWCSLSGPRSGLDYPHDVSFGEAGGAEFFAVAQRSGSISFYQEDRKTQAYGPEPIFRISGPRTRLDFSDGVAFVPPGRRYLAACNLATDRITFYRRTGRGPLRFRSKPSFELKGGSLCHPDGLAFSHRGEWLAVANHGNHTVSLFRRRRGILSAFGFRRWAEPAAVIRDPSLRYPHSVAFTPLTNHLVVTNAGANYFSVYAPGMDGEGWSPTPVLRQAVGPASAFEEVNARNKMEGGPKGVAIHANRLAVCSPGHGVLIYSFREEEAEVR